MRTQFPTFTAPVIYLNPEFVQSYDRLLISFDGSAEGLACLLYVLDLGVPRNRIELHHHPIDAEGRQFMGWPITEGYCRAIAELFDVKLLVSYKPGGFEQELKRDGSPIAPVRWQGVDSQWHEQASNSGKFGTRFKYPDAAALPVRSCDPYLTEHVLTAILKNDPRFQTGTTLVVKDGRLQKSNPRHSPPQFGPHPADNRNGHRGRRFIDLWRPIHTWADAEVWEIIERYGVVPHPVYELGWPRFRPCRFCPFAKATERATVKRLYPSAYATVAAECREVAEWLNGGARPFAAALKHPELIELANQAEWTRPIVTSEWKLPTGAVSKACGASWRKSQ